MVWKTQAVIGALILVKVKQSNLAQELLILQKKWAGRCNDLLKRSQQISIKTLTVYGDNRKS